MAAGSRNKPAAVSLQHLLTKPSHTPARGQGSIPAEFGFRHRLHLYIVPSRGRHSLAAPRKGGAVDIDEQQQRHVLAPRFPKSQAGPETEGSARGDRPFSSSRARASARRLADRGARFPGTGRRDAAPGTRRAACAAVSSALSTISAAAMWPLRSMMKQRQGRIGCLAVSVSCRSAKSCGGTAPRPS